MANGSDSESVSTTASAAVLTSDRTGMPLTSERSARLSTNLLWSFVGVGAPMLVAVYSVPLIISGIGAAKFGILSISWMVVGYFSLFDLGLGRALTQVVAESLGRGRGQDVPGVAWSSLALMAALGLVGGVVLAALAPWLAGDVLAIPDALRGETTVALWLLAASVPFASSTSAARTTRSRFAKPAPKAKPCMC